jgi:hypothetical protein
MFEMVVARSSTIACGRKDANDLDRLRHDPLMKITVGRCLQSGAALASQSTISRLEMRPRQRDCFSMEATPDKIRIGVSTLDTRRIGVPRDPTCGKVQIERDDCVIVKSAEVNPLLSKASRVDVEALALEHQLNRLRDRTIVLDQ